MLTDHLYLFGRGLLVGGSLGFPQEWRRLKTKVSKRTVPLCKWLLGLILFKAGDRTRTGDPQLGKLMLYQLSYARDGR